MYLENVHVKYFMDRKLLNLNFKISGTFVYINLRNNLYLGH